MFIKGLQSKAQASTGDRSSIGMAERKAEKSCSKIPPGSAGGTPSSRASGHGPPPKEAAGESKKVGKGGSSAVTRELRIVDLSDRSEWKIEDREAIGLLKEYKSAPDQKTRDDILKRLEKRLALLNSEAEASQATKNLPKGGAIGAKIEKRQQGEITKGLQELRLDTDGQAGKAKEVDKSTKKIDSVKEVLGTSKERVALQNPEAEANKAKNNLPKDGATGAKSEERQQSNTTKNLPRLSPDTDGQAGKAKEVDKSTKKIDSVKEVLGTSKERVALQNPEAEANKAKNNLPKDGATGAKSEERQQSNTTKDLPRLSPDTDGQAGKAKEVKKSTKKKNDSVNGNS